MAADQKAPPAGGGLTLYAHLVGATGASVPGQISSAPVMYDQSSKAQEQEKGAAAAKPSTGNILESPAPDCTVEL